MKAGFNLGLMVIDVTRIFPGLLALALLGAVPLGRAQAASVNVAVSANVVKPLEFTKKQDLDFGTIAPSGAPGTYTVSIGLNGVLSCPAGAICTGAARPAIFNVQGSNRSVVRISAVPSDLVNAVDGSTIRYTPTAPSSVTLTNSGYPGTDFNVGGSIAVPSTAEGTYSGTVQVTADYQ